MTRLRVPHATDERHRVNVRLDGAVLVELDRLATEDGRDRRVQAPSAAGRWVMVRGFSSDPRREQYRRLIAESRRYVSGRVWDRALSIDELRLIAEYETIERFPMSPWFRTSGARLGGRE